MGCLKADASTQSNPRDSWKLMSPHNPKDTFACRRAVEFSIIKIRELILGGLKNRRKHPSIGDTVGVIGHEVTTRKRR
ncbi:Protein of unknown function [Pyronema omphalodes CBS 100304]|uniref:Uncharacterized protein n=1 Tax=Pyronema omphalodes (strain CBS 100304) TaxID=1076935 RepID=U4LES7_PYROM|nr:Protein of unknown function [Pyronema omphalodes CBS 100304]